MPSGGAAWKGYDVNSRRKLTPHQKIMRAFKLGTGLQLSPIDVAHLAKDHAIIRCAQNDDEGYGEAEMHKELPK
jgi:hypothetical protein